MAKKKLMKKADELVVNEFELSNNDWDGTNETEEVVSDEATIDETETNINTQELPVTEVDKPTVSNYTAEEINKDIIDYFELNMYEKVEDVMNGLIKLLHTLDVYNFSLNYIDHKEGVYPFKKFKDNGECYNFGIVLNWMDMNTKTNYTIEELWG